MGMTLCVAWLGMKKKYIYVGIEEKM